MYVAHNLIFALGTGSHTYQEFDLYGDPGVCDVADTVGELIIRAR
jgi:hypothetical protein